MDPQQSHLRNDRPDPQQIRQCIERTRAEMDQTIDAVADRLSPRAMMEMVKGWFSGLSGGNGGDSRSTMARFNETARDTGQAVWDTIRNHPLPIAMIGAGVAWLIAEQTAAGEKVKSMAREAAHGVSERGKRLAHKAKERFAGESAFEKEGYPTASCGEGESMSAEFGDVEAGGESTGHRLRERARDAMSSVRSAGEQVKERYAQARERSQEVFEQHPLACGLGLLVAGFGLGMALPHSSTEDEYLGHKADQLKEQAKASARRAGEQALERGRDVAQATAAAASEEVQRQGLSGEGLREKAGRIVDRATDAAIESAERGQP